MTIPMWQVAEKITPRWRRVSLPHRPGAMVAHPSFALRGRLQETVGHVMPGLPTSCRRSRAADKWRVACFVVEQESEQAASMRDADLFNHA